MPPNKKFVIRSRAIIFHEGKLLLVKHPHDTSFGALPGGHLEWGEDPKECLTREIIEELGIEPEIGRLLYVNTFIDGEDKQPIEFFFEVKNSSDYIGLKKLDTSHAHEISEILWVGPNDNERILPQKISEDLKNGEILSDSTRFIK